MTIGLVEDVRNDQANVLRDAIDAGAGAGALRIYDGTKPAVGAAITSQNLLGEVTLGDPSAPNAAAGVLTFSGFPRSDASADATGTASWCRLVDSDGNAVADGTVTATGGGGDLELVTTSITATQAIEITSLTYTVPNAA